MTLSSTRGLVRISLNPDCDLLAAMVAERVNELEFYRRMTGRDYPGEYGERVSARRRGTKFETNLLVNNAALLRRALAPRYGLDPEAMTVRNLAEEVPGPPLTMRAARLTRTRRMLQEIVSSEPQWQLIVQPQLRLHVGPLPNDFEYVSPDFMVWDPSVRMYVPGEMKSFIARDEVAEPGDLDPTRRQAAAQVLALADECNRLGIGPRVLPRGLFVFATPYGLSPNSPVEESLDGAIREIRRAMASLAAIRPRLVELRQGDPAALHQLADEINTNYQENCVGSCVLADQCQSRLAGRALSLGDGAADLLGPDADIDRIARLVTGAARPRTEIERLLTRRLRDAAEVLNIDYRRLA